MRYRCAVRSLLIVITIFTTEANCLKAKAEHSNNFIPLSDKISNNTALNLTLEPDTLLVQSPNQIPEVPSQENSSSKPEQKGKICSGINNSATSKENPISVDGITVKGSSVFNQSDIDKAVQEYKSKEPTPQSPLEKLTNVILQLYLNKNYLNTIASPVDGKAEIIIAEGHCGC
jgi:POTRA domain, ShlB-type